MADGGEAQQAAAAAGGGQAAASGGWYYLVAGRHAGPYTLDALQGPEPLRLAL